MVPLLSIFKMRRHIGRVVKDEEGDLFCSPNIFVALLNSKINRPRFYAILVARKWGGFILFACPNP